jgi:hypothetical protein
MTIRLVTARIVLLGLFVACMAIIVAVVGVTYLRGAFYLAQLQQLIIAALSVYSVPLGAILGGMFGQRSTPARQIRNPAFWVALTVSAIWNLLLVARVFIFGVAREDSVTDFAGYLGAVSGASSFLVVGALAYFFTRKGD